MILNNWVWLQSWNGITHYKTMSKHDILPCMGAMRPSNVNNPLSFPSSISTVKCWQAMLKGLLDDLLEQKILHRQIKFKDKKKDRKKKLHLLPALLGEAPTQCQASGFGCWPRFPKGLVIGARCKTSDSFLWMQVNFSSTLKFKNSDIFLSLSPCLVLWQSASAGWWNTEWPKHTHVSSATP